MSEKGTVDDAHVVDSIQYYPLSAFHIVSRLLAQFSAHALALVSHHPLGSSMSHLVTPACLGPNHIMSHCHCHVLSRRSPLLYACLRLVSVVIVVGTML